MDVQEYLPLTETTFFILLSLAPQPKHGYAIMKEVQALSAGRLHLSTGTLYGAIKRLLEQAWIVRLEEPEQTNTARERKRYILTHMGRRVLEAEIERLQKILQTARLQVRGESA